MDSTKVVQETIKLLPHQWVLTAVLLFLFLYVFYLAIKNQERIIVAIKEILTEGRENILSATRFVLVYMFIVVISVWLFISLWNLKFEEIATSIISLLSLVGGLKYMQKREETKQVDINNKTN